MVGLAFQGIQLLNHLFHNAQFPTAEAGFQQFIQLVDGHQRLLGGFHRGAHILQGHVLHGGGNGHLAAEHDAGNVFGAVGDAVLHAQQFQQIGARDGQEKALGQVQAELLLQGIGLALQLDNTLLNGFDLLPIVGDHALKEALQLAGGADGHGHMLLHGLDRRAPKQVRERVVDSHSGSSPLRKCGQYKNLCPAGHP